MNKIQNDSIDCLLSKDNNIKTLLLGDHSLALTTKGKLFAWGRNDYGQIGNGNVVNQINPLEITNNFKLYSNEMITEISIGSECSSALTTNGRVFTWGMNEHGQLGSATIYGQRRYYCNPNPIDITEKFSLNQEERITKISLGSYHSAALTSKGRIYTWGYNEHGELGDGIRKLRVPSSNSNIDTSPLIRYTPLDITEKFSLNQEERITKISLGRYHSAALTSEGRVFTWGYNIRGLLGSGDKRAYGNPYPTDITHEFNLKKKENIVLITLGAYHSAALTSKGRIFTWGSNTYGQLGDGTTNIKYVPIDITNQFNLNNDDSIIDIFLGYGHSIAKTSLGKVFRWGNNYDQTELYKSTCVLTPTEKKVNSLFNNY